MASRIPFISGPPESVTQLTAKQLEDLTTTRGCTVIFKKKSSALGTAEDRVSPYGIGIIRRFCPLQSAQLPIDYKIFTMDAHPEVIVTAENCEQAYRVFNCLKYYCYGVFEKAKSEQKSRADSLASLVEDLSQQLAIAKDLDISIMVTLYREWIWEVNKEMALKQKTSIATQKVKVNAGSKSEAWVMVKDPKEDEEWEMIAA